MIIIPHKNSTITSTNVSDNSNHSRQNPVPDLRPELGNQRDLDHDIIKAYLWKQLSGAIDVLKATATHKLSATGLSLAERVGIGDNVPP